MTHYVLMSLFLIEYLLLSTETAGSILYVPDAQRGNRLPLLEKVRGKVFIASQKLGAREEAQDEPVDVLEYDEFSFYADVKKKRNKKNKKIKDEPRKIPVLPGNHCQP